VVDVKKQLVDNERKGDPLSIIEESYTSGAQIETARIINVNIDDWSVDCVSEYAAKKWSDLQVMSPYFHYMNGEGIYAQPEVGAMCWLCKPSDGRFATPFILGFQSVHDLVNDNYRGGRQNLNPGDIMLRTRDENFIILRRGGVLQMGTTPTCQSMYIPLGNILKHFCEQYQLSTFGGEVQWTNTRTEETQDGDVYSTLSLKAKEKVSTPGNDVEATIGFHGDGEATRLNLSVYESGEEDAELKINLSMTKEGDVTWDIEQNWQLTAKQDITLIAEEGSFTATASSDATMASDSGNALVKASQGVATVDGLSEAVLKSATKAVCDAPLVYLGNGATSPVIKGDMLLSFLGGLVGYLITAGATPVPPFSPVAALAPASGLAGKLSTLISQTSFTK
jgi:hypothetical protein